MIDFCFVLLLFLFVVVVVVVVVVRCSFVVRLFVCLFVTIINSSDFLLLLLKNLGNFLFRFLFIITGNILSSVLCSDHPGDVI